MASLVLPQRIFGEIKQTVFQTRNETGVRLFGEIRGYRYVVRHIIGPGEGAVHRNNRYQCDNDYAEKRFNELLKREPHLKFLGELHVHPDGEARLSSTDLATIRGVLRELPFFIAGTILRRPFAIYPVLFSPGKRIALTCVLR